MSNLKYGCIDAGTENCPCYLAETGNCIYCFGIALITVLIRVFAAYPEGVSFAILIMNCFVPLIDKFIYPKPFGYVCPEKPKKVKSEKSAAAKEETK